ncbi:hypothetical protein CEXT_415301 [Caerostris extrusa]|uniref:Uncharacterized protein n=1 Tax=Caerostris extrusa TaxID=172846 RepID=A0AAV4MSS9_CAEEX|nr:hypothetical protein CEXT_415301 [Caerostris extrusa]
MSTEAAYTKACHKGSLCKCNSVGRNPNIHAAKMHLLSLSRKNKTVPKFRDDRNRISRNLNPIILRNFLSMSKYRNIPGSKRGILQ